MDFAVPLLLLMASAAQPAEQGGIAAKQAAAARLEPATSPWLVGYWAFDGHCQSDLETRIRPDGTYIMGDGAGRWSLAGDILTMRIERRPSIELMQPRLGDAGNAHIRQTSPDEIQVDWSGRMIGRFVRCSGGATPALPG